MGNIGGDDHSDLHVQWRKYVVPEDDPEANGNVKWENTTTVPAPGDNDKQLTIAHICKPIASKEWKW